MKTLGREIDILLNYPKAKRHLNARVESKSKESRKIGRKFGFDYFDGDRNYGYERFTYNPRFWQPVVFTIVEKYKLNNSSNVLNMVCAKGFFLHDLKLTFPGITIAGVDISEYTISNSLPGVKNFLKFGNARKLPFQDNTFDFVTSIKVIKILSKVANSFYFKELIDLQHDVPNSSFTGPFKT
jgi:hypothetical protein